MKISVSTVEDRLGILTQATNSPVPVTYFSISWSSFVVPLAAVKRISSPSACALADNWASVANDIRTGKFVSVATTSPLSMVIGFL
jgi:hypothetical protein